MFRTVRSVPLRNVVVFSLHLCSLVADWFQEFFGFLWLLHRYQGSLGNLFQKRYWNDQSNTNLSICARNLVSKMPRVLSRSDSLPLNSRPLAVKSISTFLTISPRYMPLIIFSYLQEEEKTSTQTHKLELTVHSAAMLWWHLSQKRSLSSKSKVRRNHVISFLQFRENWERKSSKWIQTLSLLFYFCEGPWVLWCPDEKEVRGPTNAWTIWCVETSHNIRSNNIHWQQGCQFKLVNFKFILLMMHTFTVGNVLNAWLFILFAVFICREAPPQCY